jgi:hypothetical protein
LPFLRFTRDKRGYETTSLVHAVRQNGRSRQQLLYWFRTPPGVKVGRPALDEDAIRWIEEHNPDIEFDWQKILEARPPAASPPDDARLRRSRRGKPERRRPPQPKESPEIPAEAPAAPPAETLPPEMEPLAAGEDAIAEALEQLTHPEAEEKAEAAALPVEQSVGREQLTRLRARFAELQARITERGGDAERMAALRLQAEPLNPDAWVTDEEIRTGVESFEPKIRDLRAALGLRRRRRSRRGGRRRRLGGTESAPEPNKGEG